MPSKFENPTPEAEKLQAEEPKAKNSTIGKLEKVKPAPSKAELDETNPPLPTKSKPDEKQSTILKHLKNKIEINSYNKKNDAEKKNILIIIVSKQLFLSLLTSVLIASIITIPLSLMEISSFAVIPSVFLCGIIGGFVSIQRKLHDFNVSDLELMAASGMYMILAPAVSGLLALILYFIFLSGLLKGPLFPAFQKDSGEIAPGFFTIIHQHASGGFADYAKLLVWSFIAGYSERFVTNILGKFEGAATDQASPKEQR